MPVPGLHQAAAASPAPISQHQTSAVMCLSGVELIMTNSS